MKSFKEYLAHAEHLIENHYVEGVSATELADRLQKIDEQKAENDDQTNN